MSQPTAMVPNRPTHPEFRLWFPCRRAAGAQVCYQFDASRTAGSRLHQGTEDVCQAFLEAWGIPHSRIIGWSVERICTPFFTEFPDDANWLERYRVSWRVEIRVDDAPSPLAGSSPAYSDAYDLTSEDGPGRRPTRETCEVVAVEAAITGEPLEARLRRRFPEIPFTVREFTDDGLGFRIARLALGQLVVEDEIGRLDAVRDACRELGMVTDIPSFQHLHAILDRHRPRKVPMPAQRLALFLIGHPVNADYFPWFRERLAQARVEITSGPSTQNGHGDAEGLWGGMPCRVTHDDEDEAGPLSITVDPAVFAKAMELPLDPDRALPPPLVGFTEACKALEPDIALLPADALDEDEAHRFAENAWNIVQEGEHQRVFDLPCTAVFLDRLGAVLTEAPRTVTSRNVISGDVYFTGWSGATEVRARVESDEQARQAVERAKAGRQQQWEQAMGRARACFAEEYRAKALDDQMARWRRARGIRQYAAELESTDPVGELVEWIRWILSYADALDPLLPAPRPPMLPEPTAEDLRPYLKGWNPRGPE